MTDRIQVLAVAASLILLAVILEAVRKRGLREQYAIVWLTTGGILLLLAFWRELLHGLSALMGIYYPPSALLLIGIGLVVLILISFSIVVSELSAKVARLTQKLALLEWELQARREPEPGDPAGRPNENGDDPDAVPKGVRLTTPRV